MFDALQVGNRKIIIKGVGKLFYQEGFPISMALSQFNQRGYEVSMLYVADECMKNGWSPKTTMAKLRADFVDDIDKNLVDLALLDRFCHASYEEQRAMMRKYLYQGDEETERIVLRRMLIL